MKKTILLMLMALLSSLSLSACGGKETDGSPQQNKDKLDIYTTIYPLQYFTEEIGGQYVNVKTIYPPGSDEHTFEPSQKEMMNIADADLFIYVGLGLEGFVQKAEHVLRNQNVELFAAGESLDLEELEHAKGQHEEGSKTEDDGHHHGDINPHVWLDPLYAKQMAQSITDTLAKQMPEHKAEFEANNKELGKQFDELDASFANAVAHANVRKIVVTHAAYTYWESRYHIEQLPIAGISTTEEPSQKKLKELVDTMGEDHLKYILFEQNAPSKIAGAIQKQTGANILHLHNLAVLTEKDINNKDNYFTLMEKNAEALKTALDNR